MSTAELLAFDTERAAARAKAAAIKKALDAIPEVSADEIVRSLQRELRSVAVDGFGTLFYYHPMNIAEQFAIQAKVGDDGTMSAPALVDALIVLARNSDGSQKFSAEHFDALMNAPAKAICQFANAAIHTHSIRGDSIEKK